MRLLGTFALAVRRYKALALAVAAVASIYVDVCSEILRSALGPRFGSAGSEDSVERLCAACMLVGVIFIVLEWTDNHCGRRIARASVPVAALIGAVVHPLGLCSGL